MSDRKGGILTRTENGITRFIVACDACGKEITYDDATHAGAGVTWINDRDTQTGTVYFGHKDRRPDCLGVIQQALTGSMHGNWHDLDVALVYLLVNVGLADERTAETNRKYDDAKSRADFLAGSFK